jgi:hypothetical protein
MPDEENGPLISFIIPSSALRERRQILIEKSAVRRCRTLEWLIWVREIKNAGHF